MILTQSKPKHGHTVHLVRKKDTGKISELTGSELKFIDRRLKEKVEVIPLFKEDTLKVITVIPEGENIHAEMEHMRILGHQVCQVLNEMKIAGATVRSDRADASIILAFCEGIVLSNYQFNKYKTGRTAFRQNRLKAIHLDKKKISAASVREWNALLGAVCFTRDLVNEPLSYLTARQYSKDIQAAGAASGFKVTVWSQKKIEQMKMGGILAVNKGSVQPATFNIMEYKPDRPKNAQPIVLVGKGVVYDTGGLSLKPTPNSMDQMKCDMAGSALVVGVMMALAKNNSNKHVIGLIPAVENRPGGDAIVPGDVITMYDKTTVEVMNTDAEGRLILADALAYAKSLHPGLVLDFATLTGSTARAVSPHAMALMCKCDRKIRDMLLLSCEQTYERVVEFPLWKEYGEMLESTIADIKNLGGPTAGMITAGKFLEHFTNYPWMHFDIAGSAFLRKEMNYRGINGTGIGVRLIYHFIKSLP